MNDKLVVTDSEQNVVELAVTDIASNKTFVEHIATNQDFITKLGDNLEFINHITNNEDFITNIVNELKGKYGNVNYNPTTNTFVYYDEHGAEHDVDWSALNTTNVSFTLVNDKLVVTDSEQNVVELAVTDIASNKTFVENIATNQDFITKLGDNLEFINHITNNEAFVTNIVNELKGKYGNVNYNPTTNTFVYYDEHGVEHNVDWSALNTTNVSFTLVNDKLVVTDSEQNVVELAVTDIASNKTFVENIATNQDFITKLGDNLEFVNHITNNEDFITNVINTLKGKYGNVNYNPTTNTFVYYDEHGVEHEVDWSVLNTTNVSFTLVNDKLVVTDSEQNVVELAVTDIASNKTFVEQIATNQDFITKLGDNATFITTIVDMLKDKYGNVGFDVATNSFFYYDADYNVVHISWESLGNTKIKSFTIDEVNHELVITDTEDRRFPVAIDDLGRVLANNDVFVTNLVNNKTFTTKLGNDEHFVTTITNNEDFVTNIVNELKGKYGNVNYNPTTNTFVYYDEHGAEHDVDWSALNTTNVSFTLVNDKLVVTDSEQNVVELAVTDIASNKTFVEHIATNQDFITKLGDNLEFINHITNNEDFVTNIVNELKGKYGNVNYNPTTNTFVYYDEHGAEHDVDWSALNTTNVSFTLVNDKLVVTDSEQNVVELAVTDIASNKTFVEHIATNQDFITKLGDNLEFINHITNNEAFVTNIVNELKGKYGNVNYNPTTNTFVYYDEHGAEHDVDWSALNTTNVSFTLVNDKLVVTDSEQNVVELAVTDIASNKTFVEHIATNQDFITKLGDNTTFITTIIDMLKGKYGNVGFDEATNSFFYYDADYNVEPISWESLGNTKISSFTIDETNNTLVITDTEGVSFPVAIDDLGRVLANNDVFVTNLVNNKTFTTKLGNDEHFVTTITNNEDFITNVINTLKGKYGNVNYDPTTNTFVYYDEHGAEHDVDWSALNTTNVSFTLVNDKLVVTDSEQNVVELAVTDIASNKTFVEHIATNQDFITKLGDNTTFITTIIDMLKGKYGNVGFDEATNSFFYYDADYNVEPISWESLGNTKISSFTIDETNNTLVITDTEDISFPVAIDDLGRVLANNDVFVTNLVNNKTFTTKLGNDEHFVTTITNNEDFITNVINTLKGKYGNVNYDPTTNTFVYYDEHGAEHDVDWSALNTTNVSFTLVNDKLVVTDSEQNVVELAVTDIASNKTFVEHIATNQDFITKLGDNLEFINHITNNEAFVTNIVNELKGKYGNVNYNPTTNTFVYYDEHGAEHDVDWSALNTTNVSFTLVNDKLVVTDSEQNVVELAVTDIASNKTFVEHIATNQDFITKLGDNTTFITTIVDKLKGKYGNVGFDADTQKLFYYDENYAVKPIEWEDIVSAAETLTALTSSNADDKALLIYEDENNVENKIDLVAVLQGSLVFETYLKDYISSVSIEETTTKLNRIETGLYEYLNEEAVKNGTAGVKITVTQDVIDDFETIVDNEDVLSILTTIINNTAGDVSVEKVGEDIVIKNKAGLIVNLTEEIQNKETKTWLEHVKRREVEETPSGDIEYFVHSIKYHGEDSTDQRNQEILISELIKGSETITELDYDVQTGELIYTNEVETKTIIPLNMLVKQFESKTELIIDQDAKKLIYQGENSRKEIDLAPVIQEPWLQVATQTGATNSNQDMYVNGWVGIGYDKPSGTVNEKLRVNGSITATNSYYADYVFEKYFTGESELKYDYVFNDLNTVASFIKNNRHLPGITPISELEKGEGGYSFNVSELSIQLLEKTEELYLHIIEQANKISELEKQNEELKELEQEFEKVKQDSQSKNETLLLLVQKIEELEQTVNALKK
ncbi:hypothetical protein [Myroides odoratus]|uniref:Putative ATP-grasp target RiPP n=1 Tax=Myroides odoratus TaxID=256 RepID=A0A378RMC9_MYROD|nr:hypothetical protein [Myroides odoratus]QQU04408.1 hypothetical protein I6I89_03745 [Myroides odoratus]STZ28166.1 putative ATP-grasp target RiPP [Myroides odoratus]